MPTYEEQVKVQYSYQHEDIENLVTAVCDWSLISIYPLNGGRTEVTALATDKSQLSQD